MSTKSIKEQLLEKHRKLNEMGFEVEKKPEQAEQGESVDYSEYNEGRVDAGILDNASTVREFRDFSRDILLLDKSQIRRIIQRSHRIKRWKGGKRMVWLMYQLRDALGDLPAEEHEKQIELWLGNNPPTDPYKKKVDLE